MRLARAPMQRQGCMRIPASANVSRPSRLGTPDLAGHAMCAPASAVAFAGHQVAVAAGVRACGIGGGFNAGLGSSRSMSLSFSAPSLRPAESAGRCAGPPGSAARLSNAVVRCTAGCSGQWGWAHSGPAAASCGRRAAARGLTRRGLYLATAGSMLLGSSRVQASEVSESPGSDGGSNVEERPLRTARVTTTERIVAVGDLHGDLYQTRRALTAAGVLGEDADGRPVWTGGSAVLVQMGDVLDRGDNEIAILALLKKLQIEAADQGGAVYCLNGNHEGLNVAGDFRYVTAGGFYESALVAGLEDEQAAVWESQLRARVALFQPGGPLAREMAENYTVLIINDTVFAHGGLLPEHVEYGLEKLNEEVSQWMRGERETREPPPLAMAGMDSVMWNRMYSHERFRDPRERFNACKTLEVALEMVGCNRLVVGHTPQLRGCNCECEEKVWRIDVGMSRGVLAAAPQVLEILPPGEGNKETEVRIIPA